MSTRDVYDRIDTLGRDPSPAARIVWTILNDVTSRKGWDDEWDSFDDEIQHDIIDNWLSLTRAALDDTTNGDTT